MLTLYAVPPSLYCAKTRLCLRAKGLEWQEMLPVGGYGSAEYAAQVPAGNLPALEHEGLLLSDSEAINEYLEERFSHPAMLPVDVGDRARIRSCSRFHDTRLEPAVRSLFDQVDPNGRDLERVAQGRDTILLRLNQFAQLPRHGPLMHGHVLTLADCGFPITLTVLKTLDKVMALNLIWPSPVGDYFAAAQDDPFVAAELETYRPAIQTWAKNAAGVDG